MCGLIYSSMFLRWDKTAQEAVANLKSGIERDSLDLEVVQLVHWGDKIVVEVSRNLDEMSNQATSIEMQPLW